MNLVEPNYELIPEEDTDYVFYENYHPFINIIKKYQQDREKVNETNDCTVRALAAFKGISYTEARKRTFLCGRKPRRGYWINEYMDKEVYAGKAERLVYGGLSYSKLTYPKQKGYSVGRFANEHQSGSYLILVTGHALVVKNGFIYDHCLKPRRRIQLAYKLI